MNSNSRCNRADSAVRMQPRRSIDIRPAWPEEIQRLRHFLPGAFLADADPFTCVAVQGRVERFVGAATLR